MSRKWYGSLQNRLMENKSCEEITVGMGMITENIRSKMYTDFVEKVLELETK